MVAHSTKINFNYFFKFRCFFKWAILGLFSLFSSFQYTIDSTQMFNINFCRWLDSNHRPLLSEATALPTEPHKHWPLNSICFSLNVSSFLKNGPTPASFSFIFVFSNKQYNFYNKKVCEKCPSSVRYQDSNSQPL